jgi:hypothetical protein
MEINLSSAALTNYTNFAKIAPPQQTLEHTRWQITSTALIMLAQTG